MKQLYTLLIALLVSVTVSFGQVRIYEVYGGGGNSGATYRNDYVILVNYSNTPYSLANHTLQYASATGLFGSNAANTMSLSGSIPATGFFFILLGSGGSNGTVITTTADATGTIGLGGTAGKVALANNATNVSGPTAINVVDFVGYGTTASQFKGTGPTTNLSSTTVARRSDTYVVAEDGNQALTVAAPNPNKNATLPVTYSNFQARFTEANQVAVSWATSYEKDNAYFGVERSSDAVSFAELGRVTGKGTVTGRQDYTFTDETPAAGWNYYRLKQVDLDGTTAYSRPVAVLNEASMDSQLTIYPNPASAELNFRLKNAVQSASLIDARGVRQSVSVNNGAVNVANLTSGLYLIEVQTTNGQTLRQRLVKQ